MYLLLAPSGPSTSVLAYNGDSPRGWNDPPTFAFSKSSGSRPKLDLRKRVSHQQALHGTQQTPPYSPATPPTTFGVSGAEITDREYLLQNTCICYYCNSISCFLFCLCYKILSIT